MSQTRPNSKSKPLSNSNYQHIFSVALESYKTRTGNDLTSNPLLPRLETCNSPDAVIALLRGQIPGFDQSRSDNDSERLSNWLNPTVNVIAAFSGTISDFVGPAFPPAGLIFTGIAVLLSAATAVSNRRDTLIIIFERIENVLTAGELHRVMVEVLCILAIATREIKENRTKTYLKKLVGKTEIEDALLRLENAILEETRMAAAEALMGIHVLQDRMRGVECILEGVEDMLQGFDKRMKDITQKDVNNAENAASQTTNEADTVPVIGLATVLPVAPTVPAALSLKLVNDIPLTRMLLKQVLPDLSERLYHSFRRQVRLVVHGGAVMVLHPNFSHRECTQDVNYIHRSFVKEYRALGFMDAEQRLRECIAKTAYRFNLGADWMNNHADVALPLALDKSNNKYDPIFYDATRLENSAPQTIFSERGLAIVAVPWPWAVALKFVRYVKKDPDDCAAILRFGSLQRGYRWTVDVLENWISIRCWPMRFSEYPPQQKAQLRERLKDALARAFPESHI